MGNTVTICFANNKGGSGKSTSCSNVGAALAGMGKKVLLVDGDMQLNLSLSFFDEEEVLKMAAGEKNLYYAIGHQSDLSDFIVHTKYENLDLVPSSTLMSSVEYELFTKWQREFILRKCLQKIRESEAYDYILIDCSPSLGLITVNSLTAADSVIIPVQCEYFALEGLGKLLSTIKLIQKRLNTDLEIEGFVLTMYDARLRLSNQVVEEVRKNFQDMVFKTLINRNTKLAEAPGFGQPAILYDANSRGSEDYMLLAQELIKRNLE